MDEQLAFYERKLQYEIDSSDLHGALAQGEAIVVVDARSSESYMKEHIPGAISIPHRTMNESSTSKLERTHLYVTYCDGIGCNASTKGARNLKKLGFRVKELLGGLDWWKRDGYPTHGNDAKATVGAACGCSAQD